MDNSMTLSLLPRGRCRKATVKDTSDKQHRATAPVQTSLLLHLPLELLLDVDELLSPVDQLCLRRTSSGLKQILPRKRPWDLTTSVSFSDFAKRMRKDEYPDLVLREPTWWWYMCCSYCYTAHPPYYFTELERKRDPSIRRCKGADTAIRLCKHEVYTHAKLMQRSDELHGNRPADTCTASDFLCGQCGVSSCWRQASDGIMAGLRSTSTHPLMSHRVCSAQIYFEKFGIILHSVDSLHSRHLDQDLRDIVNVKALLAGSSATACTHILLSGDRVVAMIMQLVSSSANGVADRSVRCWQCSCRITASLRRRNSVVEGLLVMVSRTLVYRGPEERLRLPDVNSYQWLSHCEEL